MRREFVNLLVIYELSVNKNCRKRTQGLQKKLIEKFEVLGSRQTNSKITERRNTKVDIAQKTAP